MRMVMRSSIRINFLGWYFISFHAIFIFVLLLARRCSSSLAPKHTLPSYHKWWENGGMVFGKYRRMKQFKFFVHIIIWITLTIPLYELSLWPWSWAKGSLCDLRCLQGLAIQSFYLSFRRQYPGANWAWWSLQCSHDSVSSATAGPATRASLLWEWCVVRLPERKSQCRNPSWSDRKIGRAGKRHVGICCQEEFYIKKSTRMIETKATFLSGFLVQNQCCHLAFMVY